MPIRTGILHYPIKEESVDIHSVVEAAHGELDRK